MEVIMRGKSILIAAAVAATLGAGAFAVTSEAQPYRGGWGMMGGYGPGWMHGYGSGNAYGPGWMMQGGGTPPCWNYSDASTDANALNLTVDQVKNQLDRWIERQGNPRLKAGDVKEKDADTIQADVVTQDNSLVQRFEINRHTGFWRQSAS
jgi:hypothetical protein